MSGNGCPRGCLPLALFSGAIALQRADLGWQVWLRVFITSPEVCFYP